MAIHGIGTDIIQVARVQRLVEMSEKRVRARIFTEHEWEYAHGFANPFPSLAARFAAKEAGFKALRIASWKGFSWRDLEVQSGAGRIPSIVYLGGAGDKLIELGVQAAHISISHLDELASAVVVLER